MFHSNKGLIMLDDIEIHINKLKEYQTSHEKIRIEFNRNRKGYKKLKEDMRWIRESCSDYIQKHYPDIFIDFFEISYFSERIDGIINQLKSK